MASESIFCAQLITIVDPTLGEIDEHASRARVTASE